MSNGFIFSSSFSARSYGSEDFIELDEILRELEENTPVEEKEESKEESPPRMSTIEILFDRLPKKAIFEKFFCQSERQKESTLAEQDTIKEIYNFSDPN